MNCDHIDELIDRNRTGMLTKLIKVNVYKWSVDDFQYIFEQCIENRLYNIFYFMMDHFIRSDCISFYDNKEFTKRLMFVYENNINKLFALICRDGHIDMVKYLLSVNVTNEYSDINPGAGYSNELRLACAYGHIVVVKYLLSDKVIEKYPNIDVCAKNNFGLRIACQNGHVNMIKYLLSDEVTEKYTNINPCVAYNIGLKSACRYGHVDMVKCLLSEEVAEKYPKIDPCAENNQGLKLACRYGKVDMVKYLLSDEVTDNYPKLHPINLDKKRKIDIERLLGYHI